jgi:hypothetical protein
LKLTNLNKTPIISLGITYVKTGDTGFVTARYQIHDQWIKLWPLQSTPFDQSSDELAEIETAATLAKNARYYAAEWSLFSDEYKLLICPTATGRELYEVNKQNFDNSPHDRGTHFFRSYSLLR